MQAVRLWNGADPVMYKERGMPKGLLGEEQILQHPAWFSGGCRNVDSTSFGPIDQAQYGV